MSPEPRAIPRSVQAEIVGDLTCPECDAARRAADWDRFYGECLAIPELALECRAVADAVEMLRDSRAEHEHREHTIATVRDSIRHHGIDLTVDQLRVILDAYEAAA